MLLKALPFILGVLWVGWVVSEFRRDLAELKDTYDGVRKGMIIAAWAVTPLVVAVMIWWASVLIRNPRIGFQ